MLSNGQPCICSLFYLLVGWYHALVNTIHRVLHPLVSGFLQCPTHVTLFASTQAEDPKVTNFFTIDICLEVPRVINFVVFSVTRHGRNSPFLELPEKLYRNRPNQSIAILLFWQHAKKVDQGLSRRSWQETRPIYWNRNQSRQG